LLNSNFFDLTKKFVSELNTFFQTAPSASPEQIFDKFTALLSPKNIPDLRYVLSQLMTCLLQHPDVVVKATHNYLGQLSLLWQQINSPDDQSETIIQPNKFDRRFKDHEWQQNPYFNTVMQNYLLWVNWINDIIDHLPDLDALTRQKILFYVKQFTDSVAPTNFFWSNPETMRTVIETGGQSVIQGLSNFLKDLDQRTGELRISMVDPEAFRVGDNIAITPGQVIYQNELFELIKYHATTKQVYETPLLIVPPCINKYYIFDLRPENSFIKWCCDQGLNVYIMSWVNPDHNLAHKTLEDYVLQGVYEAVQNVCNVTGLKQINALSFCIGGNLLCSLNAYLTVKDSQNNPLKSTTYLATIFDFSKSGDVNLFLNEHQLTGLEQQAKIDGYICGRTLAQGFNLLRANDLIWSFMINNYYLGKTPQALDFLFWNADTTNLPSTMYIEYLRKFFLENCIINAHTLSIKDQSLDFGKVTTPTYIFSTKEDHIALWQSGYAATTLFKDCCTFVLGGSGHIAGVFNAPHNAKYNFWCDGEMTQSALHWLETSLEHSGSWWTHWLGWITTHAGPITDSAPNDAPYMQNLGPAPGTYVIPVVQK